MLSIHGIEKGNLVDIQNGTVFSHKEKNYAYHFQKKKIQLEIIIVKEWSQNQEVRWVCFLLFVGSHFHIKTCMCIRPERRNGNSGKRGKWGNWSKFTTYL